MIVKEFGGIGESVLIDIDDGSHWCCRYDKYIQQTWTQNMITSYSISILNAESFESGR